MSFIPNGVSLNGWRRFYSRIRSTMSMEKWRFYGLFLCVTFLCFACESHCIEENDLLWDPPQDHYRLEISNHSEFMVKLEVDGEEVGVFCEGVERLPVGDFPRSECSRIQVKYLDNPSSLQLDDCDIFSKEDCQANNTKGRTCYDTTFIERVEAKVQR